MTNQAGSRTSLIKWLGCAIILLLVVSGCGAETLNSKATLEAVRIKATGTARVDLTAIAQITPVSTSAAAMITQAASQSNFREKQAEDQTLIAILIGAFIIVVVMGMASVAGRQIGHYIKLRTEYELKRRTQRPSVPRR